MKRSEQGSGLIIVILVISFLLAVGIAVMTVTSTGPRVAGNVRNQEEAFNAAEAGFEASRRVISDNVDNAVWQSFADHCLREPTGIDLPFIAAAVNPDYFRRRTDEELLTMILPYKDDPDKVIFYDQPYVRNAEGGDDLRYTYTSFLIDDEAGGGTSDPGDVLLVCIGVVRAGNTVVSTARLEIVFAMQVL